MKIITTIAELMEALEGTGYFGLRGASEHDLEVEDRGYLDCSLDLWDKRDCRYDEEAELLPGTSAINVSEYLDEEEIMAKYKKALGYATNHHGNNKVYLLNDKYAEYGDDDEEIVLGHGGYGADIVAVVEL